VKVWQEEIYNRQRRNRQLHIHLPSTTFTITSIPDVQRPSIVRVLVYSIPELHLASHLTHSGAQRLSESMRPPEPEVRACLKSGGRGGTGTYGAERHLGHAAIAYYDRAFHPGGNFSPSTNIRSRDKDCNSHRCLLVSDREWARVVVERMRKRMWFDLLRR
jgi:hypothetical protein